MAREEINEAQAMMDVVSNQRNAALNETVMLAAKLRIAMARIEELELEAVVVDKDEIETEEALS